MAKSKSEVGKKIPLSEPAVSREEFDGAISTLATSIGDLTGLVKQALEKPTVLATPAEVEHEKEIVKAGPKKIASNPEWDERAREIIGSAVDHTELEYVTGGGTVFTVVIKPEASNAPTDYLERYKTDRRSREVGTEGEAGVIKWCELVRDNLKKPKPITS